MKKLVVAIVLFCCMFSLAHTQGIKPPSEGKAVIYFARPTSYAFLIEFTYFDSNKVIGRFNGKNHMRYECEPGEHLFWAWSAENKDFITADLEAGKIYLVEAVPQTGTFQAIVRLRPVDPGEIKKAEKIKELINEKSAQNMPASDIEKATKNFEMTITKALEKYKEDVAKGKKFKRLEKAMFHLK